MNAAAHPHPTSDDINDINDMVAAANLQWHQLNRQFELEIASPDAFPVETLPPDVRNFVTVAARTYGIATSYLGSAALTVAAGLIGNRAELVLKRNWAERAILWVLLIGGPGSGKTPAIDMMRKPIDQVQADYNARYQEALASWDALPREERAATPRPRLESIFTSDVTIEGLAPMLASSPGLILIADELASWLAFDRYKKGGDRPQWLSIYSGKALKVDRKTSDTIYVAKPACSVVGGLQPARLSEIGLDDDGMVDRLLPVWPAPRPRVWTEDDMDQGILTAYVETMLRLQSIEHQDGPSRVWLDDDAKQLWAQWYGNNAGINADGFAAKAPGHVARLALILHALEHGRDLYVPLAEATLDRAITLLEFFRHEHSRMVAAIGVGFGGLPTNPGERIKHRVLRTVTRQGDDGISRTDLHRKLGGHVPADELTWAIARLIEAGRIERIEVPTATRPAELFRLLPNPYERTNYYEVSPSPGAKLVSFPAGTSRTSRDPASDDDEMEVT